MTFMEHEKIKEAERKINSILHDLADELSESKLVSIDIHQVNIDCRMWDGWWFAKPGLVLNAVEKAMGLKKGQSVIRICQIEIVSAYGEKLKHISQEDVIKEGFPDWTPQQFIEMLVNDQKISPDKILNRIEFRFLN